MKKNILSLLILLASLFFVGCGSNSKTDPIAPVKEVMQNTHFSFTNTQDNLLIDGYREYSISFKVNKDGFGFPGAEVKLRSFDVKYGSIKDETVKTDENGNGTFIYTPPEKFPKSGESVTLQYVFVVQLEDNSTSELVQNINLSFDLKQSTSGSTGKYSFSNVTKELLVEAHQKYTIGFKLNKDGFGFVGEVKVKSFNSAYGTISNETVTTDTNGVGVFNYTPPEIFPKEGTKYRIEFVFVIPSEDDKKDIISENVTLNFKLKEEEHQGQANYYFNETIDKLNVTSYTQYAIPFKLNKDNFVQSGAEIKMKTFDSKYGSVEKPIVITDENGRAQFTYNPPKDMPTKGTKYTIEYVYEIILDNGEKKELTHKVILEFNYNESENGTGRATELSISYLTTTCDKDKGITGHYVVHAVDFNSRQPIVGQALTISAINGVKILNGKKVQTATGSIKDSKPIGFSDSKTSYAGKVGTEDTLIIMPTQGRADISYLGGWNIDDVGASLQLHGSYNNIKNVSGLTYLIGNEKRLLGGENGNHGSLSTLDVGVKEVLTDSKGFANFDINFDPRLGGHTAVVEAHGDENGRRFGISERISLRIANVTANNVVINNTGTTQTVAMHTSLQPSCVGETAMIDVPVNPASFHAKPEAHCGIVGGNFVSNSAGDVILEVQTSGITKAVDEKKGSDTCTISWNGGMGSLLHEY